MSHFKFQSGYQAQNNAYGFSPYSGGRKQHFNNVQDMRSNPSNWRPKKHTGAKAGQDKNGKPYISAWNYSRRMGLVNVFIAPYKGSYEGGLLGSRMRTITSKNG